MADFINTIDVLGDDAVFDSIINGSIIEFKDDKVTFIGDCAFNGCAALTTVEIPNATYVCQKGFNGCSELQNVSIPKVSALYDSAFNSCKKLKSIVMPAIYNMTSACFENCTALEMVDIHTVCPIKARNFYGCSALKALIIRGTTGVSAMSLTDSLINTPIANGTGYIYVPAALVESYKAAANWSTFADQFRKLEEWTVNGTVTGALDIENRHMVRFFNEDGTLLGYKVVPTGGNATYSGDDPVKEGDWAFKGWNPAPTNVTADMDCYAQFKSTARTWDEVLGYIADGTYKEKLSIGDTVPLDLGTEGVIKMEIVAFDTDLKADGSGYAPITWIAKDLLTTTHCMHSSGTSKYWTDSELHTYLEGTIKPMLPDEVRNAILTVVKYQLCYPSTKSEESRGLNVWVPSLRELNISVETSERNSPVYAETYPTLESREKKINGTAAQYWTRTLQARNRWYVINPADGYYGIDGYTYKECNLSYGIAIGFCT